MNTNLNINALNISPYLWWKYIDKALYFANHFSKELFQYDFSKWLEGEFNSERRVFDTQSFLGFQSEASNNSFIDYVKVGKRNSIGTLMSFSSEEEVERSASVLQDEPFIYTYSTASLHHLAFSHFNLWLIFGTDEFFYKWQAYFNFICANTSIENADVYKNLWFWVLLEIDKNEQFDDVSKYKKFIRFLHDCEKETAYLEKQWIEKRDSLK